MPLGIDALLQFEHHAPVADPALHRASQKPRAAVMSAAALPAPRLIAILAADAAGYSRLMAIDDRLTVELLDAARDVFRATCGEHQGRVVDMAGDSVLLAFSSAGAALLCALAVQKRLVAQANPQTGTLRLPFRIGVHVGDVIEKADGSLYGDGVNIAARLQALAEPDEVFVSQAVRDLLGAKPVARFEDAGEHVLKNLPYPMRVWRAQPPGQNSNAARSAAASRSAATLRFAGRYELQPRQRRLLVDGELATLGPRAFDLLLALVEQPGALLTKNQLLDRVWPGLVVEDEKLATQIIALRQVLGGDVIATIPGRGYRFAADLEVAAALPHAALTPAAPAADAARRQTNLPATLPHLVGRTEDLAALHQLIDQHRLVSIIGAGGMGKTTVALHFTAGRQGVYRHGVCWVELATVTEAEALPAAVGAALGVHIGSGDPLKGLCGALKPLTLLVTLDNAEQVVDGVARLVQAVMDQAPGVRFMVTTQAPLKLPSELVYRIGPLTMPQGPLPAAQAMDFNAVALFVERARLADARFTLTDANAPAVIDLCRQLDGLALAIELAAARAPMLGVQRLASSMGDRLKVLTSSRNRMAPARQQTLRAALEWSHGFLEEPEQKVFRRLAVFAGSASLTLLQQVVADLPSVGGLDEWAVLDALALLVDRSLVVALTPDDAKEPRYRLLDTPRLFAREKLQQAGEEAALRRRHARAVAELFDRAHDASFDGSSGFDAWHRSITVDLDNGREALACTRGAEDPEPVVQIATALGRALPDSAYLERLGLLDVVEPLIEHITSADLLARACMLVGQFVDTQPQRVLALVRPALTRLPVAAAEGSGPAGWARLRALSVLARAATIVGDLSAAEDALAEARALVDPAWPPARHLVVVVSEMRVSQARGDMSRTLYWARRRIELSEAIGSSGATARAALVDTQLAAGLPAQAAETGLLLIASLADGRDERALVYGRLNLSAALLELEQHEQAGPHLRAGWAQAPLFELQPFFADYLALLATLEGRWNAAARLAGYADASNTRIGERQPNEEAAIARAVKLLRATLGNAEFEFLHAEGATMRDGDIAGLAFPGNFLP